jgi:hypothetical protein
MNSSKNINGEDIQKLWDYLFNEETGLGTALTSLIYNAPYKKPKNLQIPSTLTMVDS